MFKSELPKSESLKGWESLDGRAKNKTWSNYKCEVNLASLVYLWFTSVRCRLDVVNHCHFWTECTNFGFVLNC